MDEILRKSLDEVDRTRKRQWIYLTVSSLCLALFVISIIKTGANAGDFRMVGAILAGAVLLALTNVLLVVGLSLFINRMTNRILKAIDLTSKIRD
jgi:hypothetical protein